MIYAFRLAGRELRGGVRGFRVFLACLVLGVGAIAAIGSLRAAVEAGMRADARLLLGGDVSARLTLRPADDAERAFLASGGTLSETASLRAMARSLDGKRRSLIELRAVDAAYPLYGARSMLAPAAAARRPRWRSDGGVFGAVVGAGRGDPARIAAGRRIPHRRGGASACAALIDRQPDAALGGSSFGPRVLIAGAALARTGLLRPGALVNYEYRIRLPDGGDAAAWIAQARAAFPQAGWQLRGSADASPSLQRLLDRVGFFLNLAGITALLVGGVGIGNAVAGYVASKTEAIATLKCLGASTGLVFAAYLLQILALALIGIADRPAARRRRAAACGPLLAGLLPASLPARGCIRGRWLRGAVRLAGDAGLCAVAARRDRPGPARRAVARPGSAGAAPSGAAGRGRDAPLAALALAAADRAERAGARASRCGISAARSPPSRCSASPAGLIVAAARAAPRAVAAAAAAGARQSAPSRRRRPRGSCCRSASVSA